MTPSDHISVSRVTDCPDNTSGAVNIKQAKMRAKSQH